MSRQGRNPAVALRLADNLRTHRRQIGISQDQLARWSGLHRTEISLIERGLREPRAQTIVKLSTALDVSADALLDGIAWRPATGGGRRVIVVSRREADRRYAAPETSGPPVGSDADRTIRNE